MHTNSINAAASQRKAVDEQPQVTCNQLPTTSKSNLSNKSQSHVAEAYSCPEANTCPIVVGWLALRRVSHAVSSAKSPIVRMNARQTRPQRRF